MQLESLALSFTHGGSESVRCVPGLRNRIRNDLSYDGMSTPGSTFYRGSQMWDGRVAVSIRE